MVIELSPDKRLNWLDPFGGSMSVGKDSRFIFRIDSTYTTEHGEISPVSDSCLIKVESYDGLRGTDAGDYTDCYFSIKSWGQ